MGTINDSLYAYVTNRDSLFYRFYCGDQPWAETAAIRRRTKAVYKRCLLLGFKSVNPEVRMSALEEFTSEVLAVAHHWPDIGFFRRLLLNREVGNHMRYEHYRDHTTHPFMAFVLGAYLVERKRSVRAILLGPNNRSLVREYADSLSGYSVTDARKLSAFAFCMQDLFVSVLNHDIGYVFEGTYEPDNPWGGSGDIRRAGMAISDFYLREWPVQFLNGDTRLAYQLFECFEPPLVDTSSISTAARSLRTLRILSTRPRTPPKAVDAFDFLRRFGRGFQSARRWNSQVEHLEDAFCRLTWDGLPGTRVRVIDHAIASGLIMLQLANYYYELDRIVFERVPFTMPPDVKAALRARFEELYGVEDDAEAAAQYKQTIRRICGAAFHNLDPDWFVAWNDNTTKVGLKYSPFPLKPQEDGLIYFTILLDVVQDWDRRTYPARLYTSILDGLDVTLPSPRGRALRVPISNKDTRERLTRDLDARLGNWRDFIAFD